MAQKEAKTHIPVYVRVRPLNRKEKDEKAQASWSLGADTLQCSLPSKDQTGFRVNQVFSDAQNTQAVFEGTAKGIVRHALEGYSGTVFAYGQTSSGKTHTMMGSPTEQGIIQLSLAYMWDEVQKDVDSSYIISVLSLEVYNEKLRDLGTGAELSINEVKGKGEPSLSAGNVKVKPTVVSSAEDASAEIAKAMSRRQVGKHDMNEQSSRSHTIFRIKIDRIPKQGQATQCLLHMVDLAGAENIKKTGASGTRAAEGSNINKSLSALVRVIHTLSGKAGVGSHVPFRDSKLTRLLRTSLGGNTKTAIVCCVTPASSQYDETMSTLRFAQEAAKVKNAAQKRVLSIAEIPPELRRTVEALAAAQTQEAREQHRSEVANLMELMEEHERRASEIEQQLESERQKRRAAESALFKKNTTSTTSTKRRQTLCVGGALSGAASLWGSPQSKPTRSAQILSPTVPRKRTSTAAFVDNSPRKKVCFDTAVSIMPERLSADQTTAFEELKKSAADSAIAFEREIAALKEQIAVAGQEKHESEAGLHAAQQKVVSIQDELERLRAEMAKSEINFSTSLQERLAHLEVELSDARVMVMEAESRADAAELLIQTKSKELKKCRTELSEMSGIADELLATQEAMSAKTLQADSTAQQCNAALELLQKRYTSLDEDTTARHEELSSKHDTLQTRLNTALTEVEQRNTALSSKTTELHTALSTLASLQEEMENLRENQKSVETNRIATEDMTASIVELERQVVELTEERDSQQDQLVKACELAQASLKEKDERCEELQQEAFRAQEARCDEEMQKHRYEQELAAMHRESRALRTANGILERAEEERNGLRNALELLQKEFSRLCGIDDTVESAAWRLDWNSEHHTASLSSLRADLTSRMDTQREARQHERTTMFSRLLEETAMSESFARTALETEMAASLSALSGRKVLDHTTLSHQMRVMELEAGHGEVLVGVRAEAGVKLAGVQQECDGLKEAVELHRRTLDSTVAGHEELLGGERAQADAELKQAEQAFAARLAEAEQRHAEEVAKLAAAEELKAQHASELEAMKGEVDKHVTQIATAKEEHASELEAKKGEVEKHVAEITATKQELEAMKGEVEKHISHIHTVKEEHASELEVMKGELEKHVAEITTTKQEHASELEAMKGEIDKHVTQINTAKEEHASELEAKKGEVEKHVAEITTTKQELEAMKGEVEKHISHINTVKEEHASEIEAMKGEVDKHVAEITTTKQEHASELEAMKGEIDKHVTQINTAKEEHASEIEAKKGEVEKHISHIHTVKEEHASELSAMKGEVEKHVAEITTTKQDLEAMKGEVDKHVTQIATTKEEHATQLTHLQAETAAAHSALEDKLRAAVAEGEAAREAAEQLRGDTRRLQEELRTAQHTASDALYAHNAVLDTVQEEKAAVERLLADTKEKAATAEKAATLAADRTATQLHDAQTETQLIRNTLTAEKASHSETQTSLTNTNTTLNDTILAHSTALSAATSEITALKNTLQQKETERVSAATSSAHQIALGETNLRLLRDQYTALEEALQVKGEEGRTALAETERKHAGEKEVLKNMYDTEVAKMERALQEAEGRVAAEKAAAEEQKDVLREAHDKAMAEVVEKNTVLQSRMQEAAEAHAAQLVALGAKHVADLEAQHQADLEAAQHLKDENDVLRPELQNAKRLVQSQREERMEILNFFFFFTGFLPCFRIFCFLYLCGSPPVNRLGPRSAVAVVVSVVMFVCSTQVRRETLGLIGVCFSKVWLIFFLSLHFSRRIIHIRSKPQNELG